MRERGDEGKRDEGRGGSEGRGLRRNRNDRRGKRRERRGKRKIICAGYQT